MVISELINKLAEYRNLYGNIEVNIYYEDCDYQGYFCDITGVEEVYDSNHKLTSICIEHKI